VESFYRKDLVFSSNKINKIRRKRHSYFCQQKLVKN